MKNNVTQMKSYDDNIEDKAWKQVFDALAVVTTMNKMMPKAIPRSGKSMEMAITELLDALYTYVQARVK